jgi:site-specific DNA-methyltransferase (adenine-specific)
MPGRILVGDVRDRLAELADSSVDCVITSPKYFRLRDYGHPGQLGMEPDIAAWVANLRAVCHEIARVLKPTGSFWLNVGDGYSRHAREGAPPKSLLLGPQRLAIALAEDGWLIRNQVIWAKTNSTPTNVADRLSGKYEVLFFLVRSKRYFFDLDAVRVPFTGTRSKQPDAMRYRHLPAEAVPRRKANDENRWRWWRRSVGGIGSASS